MYVLLVTFDLDPARAEEFQAVALTHAARCRKLEPGCLAFEILRSPEKPERFCFYECYINKAAVEDVHDKTAYLAEFREKTNAWIVSRERRVWESVNPS